ncbi:O-antigen ligase family protein [Streptomyces argenteolus]|uniref:O-antigen ligase family protein n=1 Tax=Streptomyces argenteolus TaxID=67274 RepID=A0ABW6X6N4_9ACTN
MTLTVTAPPAPRAAPQPPGTPGGATALRRTWRDRWPLLPLVATVLLVALPSEGPEGGSVLGGATAADLVSGVAVLVCAARLLFLRRRPLTPAAALVLGLPALGLALATVCAGDPAAALPGFVRHLQVFVLVPAAVLLLVRDARDFRVLAGALVLLAVVQGATGVHQYATGSGASYMGEDVRAVGTFGPGDVMGMATVVGYGLLVAVACTLRTPAGAPRWLRPWAPVTAALLLVPLALSFSRGAWIATAAGVLVVIALTGFRQALRSLAVLGAAAVVLVGGFGVGSEMIAQRLTSITEVTSAPDRSVSDRYTMWAAAEGMWREHPATGVGLKGFPAYRDAHASIGLSAGSDTAGAGQEFRKQPLLSPHNMYLLVLSEQGMVGFTLLAGSWAALLAAGVRRLSAARAGGGGGHAKAVDCGLAAVGLMTWQTVDFLYADIGGPSTVLTGIVLGLAAWWALAEPERTAAA